jgi:trk system potassium uptake protein TrkH
MGVKLMSATFQSAAARTAGFSTVPWDQAHSVTEFIWLVLMMIGGASGSTAGGVKIATVAVILIAVMSTFRGETEADVFHRRIPAPEIMRAMAVITFFLALHFSGTLLLASSEVFLAGADQNFIKLLFETMSALATVGLSTGITPDLTDSGKLVLCVLMFVGRLGPLTLAYALQMRSHQHRYRYPSGYVRIG